MTDPPLEPGAVKATVAVVCPVVVADPIVGGAGAVPATVVIELDAPEAPEVPALLVAVTVNV